MPAKRQFPGAASSDTARLVRRVTNGATSAEVARARSLGYERYLEHQLDYTRIDDSEADAFVTSHYPALTATTADNAATPSPTLIKALQEATLYRAAFSKRQLYQRMVEFWTDHFNVAFDKVGVNKIDDDRDVIRRYALENFGDLLRASSRSVAMLGYLDQGDSRAGHPNQNYARELMELHTVGVKGGYTQQDVAELSRVLTGWTFERQWGGKFYFDSSTHDWDAKHVLDVDVAAAPSSSSDGIGEGERVIERLLADPSTARFIATKLLKWLLTPTPSEMQIATVARVYTKTKGDVKAMVRATLNRKWLREAPPKFKRPLHYVASAFRALSPTVTGLSAANGYLTPTGHELFEWLTPDGYPDSAEYWEGNLLARWRVANDILAETRATEFQIDVSSYHSTSPAAAVGRIDRELFAEEMPELTHRALVTFAAGGGWNESRARETLALALSAPAFQWY